MIIVENFLKALLLFLGFFAFSLCIKVLWKAAEQGPKEITMTHYEFENALKAIHEKLDALKPVPTNTAKIDINLSTLKIPEGTGNFTITKSFFLAGSLEKQNDYIQKWLQENFSEMCKEGKAPDVTRNKIEWDE